MIYHVLRKLDYDRVTFIYNKALDAVGFRQYVLNNFRSKTMMFVKLDFQTRGPAETLLLGLKSLYGTGQLLVLDNDNIYEGLVFDDLPKGNILLYNNNPTGLSHYSFVEIKPNNMVSRIVERNSISDYVCVGGYGFESIDVCRDFCKQLILEETDETYLSSVFQKMICAGLHVHGHYVPGAFSIGTEKDIMMNASKLERFKLRVVFDLDNTLVTWPNVFKDYSTVDRIDHMVKFAAYLRENGHEVIIATARNTVTSGHNIGKLMKNVGMTTLNSLQQLGIEYDEIHFGKPYGDLYIDDRCFNTYDESLFAKIGFYDFAPKAGGTEFKTNRYNIISRVNKSMVQKSGPCLDGEIFAYRILTKSIVAHLFPKFIQQESDSSFRMEFINGTQLGKIYCEGLLQEKALTHLLDTVHAMHEAEVDDGCNLSKQDLNDHYLKKFEERSAKQSDFPFSDFKLVHDKIKAHIEAFLEKDTPVSGLIHGDLWFSNIMMYKKEFKFFDMRGKVHDKLTVKGHRAYDWAKLYQSIVGLDSIIDFGTHIDSDIKEAASNVFWTHLIACKYIGVEDRQTITVLTAYLLYNTFHAYDENFSTSRRRMVWGLVKECLDSADCQ